MAWHPASGIRHEVDLNARTVAPVVSGFSRVTLTIGDDTTRGSKRPSLVTAKLILVFCSGDERPEGILYNSDSKFGLSRAQNHKRGFLPNTGGLYAWDRRQ